MGAHPEVARRFYPGNLFLPYTPTRLSFSLVR